MHKYTKIRYITITLLLWGIGLVSSMANNLIVDPLEPQYNTNKSKAINNKTEVIVALKKDASLEFVSNNLSTKRLSTSKILSSNNSNNKNYDILVSGEGSTEDIMSSLENDSNVRSVSPNYTYTLDAIPNDPSFNMQWGLHNTGQIINGLQGTANADINAPESWDTETNASQAIVVVMDSGVFYEHEDLKENMWVNENEIPNNGIDDDSNGFIDDVYGYDFASDINGTNDSDPMDIDGHGTHLAGIIGARGDNGIGVSGTNWNVKIMALKVVGADLKVKGSSIIEAINYILMMKEAGVNIVAVNASYSSRDGSKDDPVELAIKELGAANIAFITSAGNRNKNNDNASVYPASYQAGNIITVAASDQNDTKTLSSSYGLRSVDIAAPGSNILSSTISNIIKNNILIDEDIESGEGNWTKDGTWAITDETNSSNFSWSDSPNANYTNNSNSSIAYNQDVDLSAYLNQYVAISADINYSIESGWDYLYIEGSGDGGSTWTVLGSITGSSGGEWLEKFVLVPEVLKTEYFRIRFRFVSDSTVTSDGAHIDNIKLSSVEIPSTYDYKDGTSMSSAFVSGAVALLAAEYPEDDIYTRINRIFSGADPLASLDGKVSTGARLNIENAIDPSIPMKTWIAEVNQTEGLIDGVSINIKGREFGTNAGTVNFSDENGNSLDGLVTSWSNTQIEVTIPSGAGKYIDVNTSSGVRSFNSVVGTAWKTVAPMQRGRGATSAVSYNDKIYIFGGYGPGGFRTSSEVYDAQNDSWSTIADVPSPRRNTSSALLNGKIFVMGGSVGPNVLDTVEAYDPVSDTWDTSIAPLPAARQAGEAAVVNGELYYIAGASPSPKNSLYKYNENNNTWSQMANLNTSRRFFSASVYNGKLYVMGGLTEGPGLVFTQSVEVYDPVLNTWSSLNDMPVPRIMGKSSSSSDGIFLVAGRIPGPGFPPQSTVLRYDPTTDTWDENAGSMLELSKPKFNFALTYVPNRGFYAISGWQFGCTRNVYFLDMPGTNIVGTEDIGNIDEDGGSIIIDVLTNDIGADTNTSITNLAQPANGTVTISGSTIIYTPNDNFNGTDTFTYTPNDGTVDGIAVTVTITVNPIADTPVGQDDAYAILTDTSTALSVLNNDSDGDNETLSISNLTQPTNGTVSISGTDIIYTPNPGYAGDDTFTYTPNDGTSDGNTVNVSLHVSNLAWLIGVRHVLIH